MVDTLGDRAFQSRLPGVGGSAPVASWGEGVFLGFQSRLPGVGGSADPRGDPMTTTFQSRLPGVGGSAGVFLGTLIPRPLLSIPFAGSWGLRQGLTWRTTRSLVFQSRLPGVGGSAGVSHERETLRAQLSIPFAGSWGLRPCCSLTSSEWGLFQSRLPGVGGSAGSSRLLSSMGAFNPVCRELGAPPRTARTGSWCITAFNPVCRELGAPPRLCAGCEASGGLSIPFAGSWGLRRGGALVAPRSGVRPWQRFQSRLPGVGGSARFPV